MLRNVYELTKDAIERSAAYAQLEYDSGLSAIPKERRRQDPKSILQCLYPVWNGRGPSDHGQGYSGSILTSRSEHTLQ